MKPDRDLEVRFQKASDQSLLIYFGPERSGDRDELAGSDPVRVQQAGVSASGESALRRANRQVLKLLGLLEREPIEGVRNLHPGYRSVLVDFDGLLLKHEEVESSLKQYLGRLERVALPPSRLVEIPVCYGEPYGPDLAEVAAMHGLTQSQVIELHSSTEYLAYFLGFVPGFAYLGELPEQLVTPRRATPRGQVPAGSVGIAGHQTGVYPFATPGGWRLLGRTPLEIFRGDREGLSLVGMGDRVRFVPVTRERFGELERR